jgi:hypothetical protein
MKYYYTLVFCFLVTVCNNAYGRSRASAQKQGVTLLGSIEFPHEAKSFPVLTVLYKGIEYTIQMNDGGQAPTSRGYFEVYDPEQHHILYLVVTQDLQIPFSRTITALETLPGEPYRVFKFTRVIDDHSEGLASMEDLVTWDIQELAQDDAAFKIPDNALILFMDPAFIETLEATSWHAEQPIVRLPRIIFKHSVDVKALHEVADKVQVALINFKFMHKKPSAQIIPYQNRTLAMPQWATGRISA